MEIAGGSLEAFLHQRIMSPIGIPSNKWSWGSAKVSDGSETVVNGGAGNLKGGGGIRIASREFARVGLLLLNEGSWDGQQLLNADWIRNYIGMPQVPATLPLFDSNSSSDGPGRYGYGSWTNGIGSNGKRSWPNAPEGTYAFGGFNNNVCFVIPEWDMVLVRQGTTCGDIDIGSYDAFFAELANGITSNEKSPLPGQIIVDPDNPAQLVYNRDGNKDGNLDPYYLCAPGDPEGFLFNSDYQTETWSQASILDALKQHGGNGIYFQAIRSHGGDGGPTENPFVNNDPSQGLDQTVLDQWKTLFTEMDDNGITIYFFFYDDSSSPFGEGKSVSTEERAFLKRLVNSFEHHEHLIWCIAEEYSEKYSKARIPEIAQVIKGIDDHNHVVAVHQLASTTFDFADDPNIDQFSVQMESAWGSTAQDMHAKILEAMSNADGAYHVNMSEAVYFASKTRDEVRRINLGYWYGRCTCYAIPDVCCRNNNDWPFG